MVDWMSSLFRHVISDLHDHATFQDSSSVDRSLEVGSFFAVNPGQLEHNLDFWVVKILDMRRDKQKRIIAIRVHRYTFYNSSNIYIAKYKPSMLPDDFGSLTVP